MLAPVLGGRYRLCGGELTLDERGGADLIETLGPAADRRYRPFAIPELCDPGERLELDARKAEVAAWITHDLRDALRSRYPEFGVDTPLRFVVEAVFPGQSPGTGDTYTLTVDAAGASVVAGADSDWDLYNLVAGTMLWEVIVGRRAWGEALLAGALRAASRAYAIGPRGLTPAYVGETFLYYALSYDESTRRAVHWQLARARE